MLTFYELVDWLRVGEYGRAKNQADDDIVARQSRRNTLSQDGVAVLTEDDLKAASERADKNMAWLDKKAGA